MENLKVKYCKHLPFKGYMAMFLFNYLIIRSEYKDKPIAKHVWNHENIHHAQLKDFWIFGYVLFYLLYVLEWILKLPSALFGYNPYFSISFEQEAYLNEYNSSYLYNRKNFAWVKYLFKFVKHEN